MPLRFHRQQLNGQALFIAKVCCVEVCSQQKLSITPMKSKRLKKIGFDYKKGKESFRIFGCAFPRKKKAD